MNELFIWKPVFLNLIWVTKEWVKHIRIFCWFHCLFHSTAVSLLLELTWIFFFCEETENYKQNIFHLRCSYIFVCLHREQYTMIWKIYFVVFLIFLLSAKLVWLEIFVVDFYVLFFSLDFFFYIGTNKIYKKFWYLMILFRNLSKDA